MMHWKTQLEVMVRDAASSLGCATCRQKTIGFSVLSANDANSYTLRLNESETLSPRASESKKAQFTSGRAAGRLALQQAGLVNPPAISRGPAGEPLWPKGFTGSITHCSPWSIAVAVPCANRCSIGVDLESVSRAQREDISSLICTDDELRWIKSKNGRNRGTTMIFSAKEAVYKAFYRLSRRYIDFKEVSLSWFPERECFLGRFLNQHSDSALPHTWFEVRCRHYDDWVFSALVHAGS